MKRNFNSISSFRRKLIVKLLCIVVLLLFYLNPLLAETCGDVNDDNNIDIVDALLIAQAYVGGLPLPKSVADVNTDDMVDIVDALLVAQFYVNIITELPGCPGPVNPPVLPKHWHEINSFGTSTKGGLGGSVYKVTNLNNSDPGSIRDAISSGNRLIVFEVGGVIDLEQQELRISASDITVAGQTAPSPGISLIRGTFLVTGDDVVVSHITTQFGTDTADWDDAANIRGDNNVFDHVAVYWARDETLTIQSVNNVTVYKSIVAEGLQYAGHEDVEHSKGSLINKSFKKLALIGNLYANNALRNPRIKGNEIFIANHIVYHWAPGWDHEGPKPDPDNPVITDDWFNKVVSPRLGTQMSMVGSVAMQGPESVAEHFISGHYDQPNSATAYVNDNIIIDEEGNDLFIVDETTIDIVNSPPIWPEGYEPLPAHIALYEVLRTVGPRPGDRNFHNKRLIRTMADNTGSIIDSENEVGGYPTGPATTHSITVPDGIQARQDWLDALEDEIAIDREIDLSRLYGLVGSMDSDIYHP